MSFVIPTYVVYIAIATVPTFLAIRYFAKVIIEANRKEKKERAEFAEQNRRQYKEQKKEKEMEEQKFFDALPLPLRRLLNECLKSKWVEGRKAIITRFFYSCRFSQSPRVSVEILEELLTRIFSPLHWNGSEETAKEYMTKFAKFIQLPNFVETEDPSTLSDDVAEHEWRKPTCK